MKVVQCAYQLHTLSEVILRVLQPGMGFLYSSSYHLCFICKPNAHINVCTREKFPVLDKGSVSRWQVQVFTLFLQFTSFMNSVGRSRMNISSRTDFYTPLGLSVLTFHLQASVLRQSKTWGRDLMFQEQGLHLFNRRWWWTGCCTFRLSETVGYEETQARLQTFGKWKKGARKWRTASSTGAVTSLQMVWPNTEPIRTNKRNISSMSSTQGRQSVATEKKELTAVLEALGRKLN